MKLTEKIAKAIYDKYMENLIGCCEPAWNELQPDHKERLIESAKAGVKSLKQECTDAMVQAVYSSPVIGSPHANKEDYFENRKADWDIMLDVILKDE